MWVNRDEKWPPRNEPRAKAVAENRKARFNYEIGEVFEAGIVLTGSEVKSLRKGKATIAESYADASDGEIWLINSNIPEYPQAHRFNHLPKRPRKLLLHQRQIEKLAGAVDRDGMTIVPLKVYFNDRAAPRSRSPSPRARSCTTSARPKRSAVGSASAAG